jgi:Mn-dependent DtxR family transcriptional regulator
VIRQRLPQQLCGAALGQETAKKIYERHCFFTDRLIAAGVDPKQAEKEACRMEHVISDESFSKLKASVNNEDKAR